MVSTARRGGITQSEYDKKATELKHRQTELRMRIEQHGQARDEFRTTLESLISLASRAAEIFEGSKTERKRQLIAFVFSNLKLKGKKLEFSLRSPFDLMVNRRSYASWLLKITRSRLSSPIRPLSLMAAPEIHPARPRVRPFRWTWTLCCGRKIRRASCQHRTCRPGGRGRSTRASLARSRRKHPSAP